MKSLAILSASRYANAVTDSPSSNTDRIKLSVFFCSHATSSVESASRMTRVRVVSSASTTTSTVRFGFAREIVATTPTLSKSTHTEGANAEAASGSVSCLKKSNTLCEPIGFGGMNMCDVSGITETPDDRSQSLWRTVTQSRAVLLLTQ